MTNWFTDELKYVRQTDNAVLFEDSEERDVWLPKSAIETDYDFVTAWPGDLVQVTITQRLAEEKGLC